MPVLRHCAVVAAFAALVLGSHPVHAFAVFTVGSDAACTHSTIQAAVDAAAGSPGEDYVWIATNQSYSGQHVVVTDQDVDIEGGFADCSDVDPETLLTTVSGAGNGGGAVFAIRGTSHVLIYNLFIRDADRGGNGDGGGIDFAGNGNVTLVRTTVSLNSADYGGGINVRGTGGDATLTLGPDTLILNNTANVSGGGIRIEGSARLVASSPQTLIGYNHALGGYGGGIEVLGPARADIGSPGYNGSPVVQFNEADYGGGIAVAAPVEDVSGVVNLFTTDPDNPVQISGNTAFSTGGGIWLQPYYSGVSTGYAWMCARDFRINDNIAQEGAAIYADLDSNFVDDGRGSYVFLNPPSGHLYCGRPAGAVACSAGVACNEISFNTAQNDGGDASGAIVLMQTGGLFEADRIRMQHNRGRHAFRAVADAWLGISGYEHTTITNCLITDNDVASSLILQTPGEDASTIDVQGCTIARNTMASGSVFELGDTDTAISYSIIDQPGFPSAAGGDPLDVSYVLASDTSTLGGGFGIVQGAPEFVDADNGNYRLVPTSIAVDFGTQFLPEPAFDLDGRTRYVDLPDTANRYGGQDLGPYETQLGCAGLDTIYCDGFDEA